MDEIAENLIWFADNGYTVEFNKTKDGKWYRIFVEQLVKNDRRFLATVPKEIRSDLIATGLKQIRERIEMEWLKFGTAIA